MKYDMIRFLNMNEIFMNDKTRPSGFKVYLRLLQYVKPHWKIFVLSIIGYLMYSSSQPLLATMAGWLADAVYTRENSAVYLIPLALLGIYFLRGLGSFIGNYFIAKVSLSIVRTMRNDLFVLPITDIKLNILRGNTIDEFPKLVY